LVLAVATTANANVYEVFVDIETEEDLYDLQAAGQISDETLETLIELYQRGVDLNTATRNELYNLPNLSYPEVDSILDYRKEVGFISDPINLVAANVLDERKLLAIAPFLLIRDRKGGFEAHGFARYQVRWSAEDDRTPPMAIQTRVNTLKHLTVGVAGTLTNNRISTPVADPNRDGLSATAPATRFNLPKFYAFYDAPKYAVMAGSYRIGFGQRLTFDASSQYQPNGIYLDDELFRDTDLVRKCKESAGELEVSPCTGVAGDIYVTPDFRWSDRLMGVAAGLKAQRVGKGTLQAYGFGSYKNKSIYQYELYNKEICEDPRNDDDPNCSAPDVFVTRDDPLEPTSRLSFVSLPNMFTETLAGGNITYSFNRRTKLGLTGYGADINFLTDGIELDFQEWSRFPYGGPFGAVGMNGQMGFGTTDVFVEVARSFDSMLDDGNGGFGALARSVTTIDTHEVEGSLRYYDKKFANPYARPIAAPDTFDGLRARDEVGGRVRYTGKISKRWNLRANMDLWTAPEEEAVEGLAYVRSDMDLDDRFRWGVWVQYQNKDFTESSGNLCFEISTEEDENGEPIPCAGQKVQFAGRLRYAPNKKFWIDAQYKHELLDDNRYMDKFREDVSAYLTATAKPSPEYRIRARLRYLYEDISDNMFLEQSAWAYVDFTYRLRKRDRLRLRYDTFFYLDDRSSSNDRQPSPEHWLWAEYEARF
jgi:hypothetical protein